MELRTYDQAMKSGGLDSYGNFIGDMEDQKHFYMVAGQSRDSSTLERSNFECFLSELGGESDTVQVHRFGHWAVGWIEEILIDPTDTTAVDKARSILAALDNYPVVNEDHFSELQWNEAADFWQSLPVGERVELCQKEGISIFEARHNWLPQSDNGGIFEYLTTD